MDEFVVPHDLRRNHERDAGAVVDAAVWLIEHMCEHIGVRDLGGLDVLDVGCGTRFTNAIISRGLPLGSYVGVDTASTVVDFLRAEVTDPRFSYAHIDAYNARYNTTGRPLAELAIPELEHRQFDLICLFSVFTHLDPADYVTMLRKLRPFVKSGGRLFFTLFIDERTEGGYGFVDGVVRKLGSERPEPPDFADADPDRPLWVALFSRRHAIELVAGTGWAIEGIFPPGALLQHHIVCAPTS